MTTSATLVETIPGLTYRRLDYWCRAGYIGDPADGSGYARSFRGEDVLRLRHITHLVTQGFEVKAAVEMADTARLEFPLTRTWSWASDDASIRVQWSLPRAPGLD